MFETSLVIGAQALCIIFGLFLIASAVISMVPSWRRRWL